MEWLLAVIAGSLASNVVESVVSSGTTAKGGNLMGGLPVEMITMLGSSLLGGFMTIWGQSMKAKQQQQERL